MVSWLVGWSVGWSVGRLVSCWSVSWSTIRVPGLWEVSLQKDNVSQNTFLGLFCPTDSYVTHGVKMNASSMFFVLFLLEGNLLKSGNSYPFGGKPPKTREPFSFGGKPPKAQQPLLWTTTDQRLPAEELKYSYDRAPWHQRPTNSMLEVWQDLASFSGRPIGSTIEVLLAKVVNQRSSVLLIVVLFVPAAVIVS